MAFNRDDLIQAIKDGARLRLRPKVMTVPTIARIGAEVMKRWPHRSSAA